MDCKLSKPENEVNEFKKGIAFILKFPPIDCKLSKPENDVSEIKE